MNKPPVAAFLRLTAQRSWQQCLAWLVLCLIPAWTFAGEPVGQVVFVAGGGQLQRQGQWQELSKNTQVKEGDTLQTAADGHVHLRMNDNGFVALRPGSRLQIIQYHYAPLAAEQNRVLLHLDNGVARTISGKAGEASKQRYRFTTPVAAIGLRGTDYVVQADTEYTRVNVLKGAIMLNPLGAGCSADLESPCATPYVRELSARNPGAYLELRMRGNTPIVTLHENGRDSQAPGSQPHPEEPLAKTEKGALEASRNSGAESSPPAVAWGRWQHIATPTPTLVSQLFPGREVVYGNELFGLMRPTEKVIMPQGAVALNFNAGEAWIKNSQGELLPVSLSQGALSLDFDKRQFNTTLQAVALGNPLQLQAQGNITFQGLMQSDPRNSNMKVSGVITSHAQEAGYLFSSQHAQGSLYGATHWKR